MNRWWIENYYLLHNIIKINWVIYFLINNVKIECNLSLKKENQFFNTYIWFAPDKQVNGYTFYNIYCYTKHILTKSYVPIYYNKII